MNRKILIGIVFASLVLGVSAGLAHGGHAHLGVFPGWFTLAQAQQGQKLVYQQCAGCHGANLEGRYGPPLSGPRFLSRWGGQTAQQLQQYILERMPLGQAGSLSQGQSLELVAYILHANGYPAGNVELKPEMLGHIELIKP